MLDGVASIIIGLMLVAISSVLVYESRSLMLGEGVDPKALAEIRGLVESDPDVVRAQQPLTMYFGPDQIMVALDIQFRPGLRSEDIERTVNRIEDAVRGRLPKVRHIFLEARAITAHHVPETTS